MDPIAVMLILLAVGAGVVIIVIRRAAVVFVLRIQDGKARVIRGKPPPGFASACEEVCRLHGLSRGEIRAVRTGAGQELRFSKDIPERLRQPFRNVWTPPPGGGGGGGMRASR
ncbi:hypothetical protein CAI21_19160 [Alkalilimnicola ehrlichii]|uniref:DUF3634 family protein n=1 Tax=Alkalilimnicola ehrlichii TaxID=351052 RepID=A0A3E0WKC3_9GAMM|nr:DUF3634 family protein [Alkalilimnicola ehrlichii]RFA25360.1 hypothetical protein CAI21_19160 [Alkalilimnicola ehrlichii]RFA32537.1 hypothetical protein CAL65_19430 [Alkalilimnicola ehrlichii]